MRLTSNGACLGIASYISAFIIVCSGFGEEPRALNTQAMHRSIASGAEEIAFRVGKADFVLKRIAPGDFDLGSPATDKMAQPNEIPMRRIHITKAFYIGKFKVTQLQYREVIGKDPSKFQGDSLPVEGITYFEALAFCQALSKLASINVVLPTEAQWEYACRAGTQTRYYSGDEEADLDKVAWYMGNSRETTHEVGKKKANAWGLYDMLGNVWEPCLDNLPKYGEIEVDNADPVGRVSKFGGHMRGGGWQYPAEDCRAARRQLTNDRFGGMGVRIAINLEKSSENGNPGVEKTPIKTGKD